MGSALPDFVVTELEAAFRKGLSSFGRMTPVSLPVWAVENFYLSAESSYVEQRWVPWSFQPAIMACMGHDDIEEVDVKKSARVGYTKMLLAAACYFLRHKRRNGAIWQPTDEDRDQFVKTELEPALRDVKVMADIFPDFLAKNKANTLKQKMLIGCTLHTLGGKAAKNYRRISIDFAALDEISGFDQNIENEGSAHGLASKRIEGASFPKLICGSTPKLKDFCQIESRVLAAPYVFRRHIPCPACGEYHPLRWGDKKTRHGMKWVTCASQEETVETVKQLCPHCGVLYDQSEFLGVEARGEWRTDSGIRLTVTADGNPEFWLPTGEAMPIPRHVAFDDLWSAYSPNVSWTGILRDYLNAIEKARRGDKSDLQTWINTTLGQTYEEKGDRTESHELEQRAEKYALRTIPIGGLILTAGVDTQDDRWEVVVIAHGRADEKWFIDYEVIYGNPTIDEEWAKLDAYLNKKFRHASGQYLAIESAGIDTGGHNTHQAYNYCRTRERRRILALKGDNQPGKPIKGKASLQDVNWRGKVLKHGVRLWMVGTDTAKDLIHGQFKVEAPGPGYIHFPAGLPTEFYHGLTIEKRLPQRTASGYVYRWICPTHGRNEPLDCTVYALFAAHYLDLHRYTSSAWERLERIVQPPTLDLFAADPLPNNPDETGEETTAAPEATPEEQKPQPAPAQKTTPQRQKAPARKNPANRRPMIGW